MNQFKRIEQEILDTITPSEKDREQLKNSISTLSKMVKEKLMKHKQNAEIELVGSTAKDTFLKDNLDIDLFIIFPSNIPEEIITNTTLEIGRNILNKSEECYAEHPYIRGYFKSYKVELVPCYQITDVSQKITAVDRTPLHTRYIQQHLTDKQKQEVRLLKQFLSGIGCYGAEAEIQGFSGYLCELLIIKYKEFHQVLQHAIQWTEGVKLSLSAHPISEFEDPLIFIDPVDKDRNVAAAIAPHTFHRFITASKDYLNHPKTTFFFPNPTKPWTLDKIKNTIKNQTESYLGICFSKPHIINENLYPQIRKTCNAIRKASTQEGFTIYDTRFHLDRKSNLIYIIIKTDNKPLSETFTHIGPPITLKKNTEEFIAKWTDHDDTISPPFQKDNRTYVIVKRSYRHLKDYLEHNLSTFSLGKHLDLMVSKDYTMLTQHELIIPELRVFWTQYLDDKKPWER